MATNGAELLNRAECDLAATDEPLAETVNKAAVEKVKTVDWNKYQYSVILVPGAGPGLNGLATDFRLEARAQNELRNTPRPLYWC